MSSTCTPQDSNSDYFVVQGLGGKKKLSGNIKVNGAKNAVLKMLAGSLLFKDEVVLKNVPAIEDVRRVADLLEHIGVGVKRDEKKKIYTLDLSSKISPELCPDISKRIRASVVLTGPLLARLGEVYFPHPGGCVIGERPIDLFLDGFEKMGATVEEKNDMYHIKATNKKLQGAILYLRHPSVTVTETFMMAAVLAKGKTVIKNAALEPEIEHLAEYLNSCGAKITGAGTPTITIQGTKLLSGKNNAYITPPDRIEAGSFVLLAALAGKDVTITHCEPNHLESLIEVLRVAGVTCTLGKSTIRIQNDGKKANEQFTGVNIKTLGYPGFPTDLQAPFTVFLTQSTGESLVFETIFEGRLNYTETLTAMGARITMMDPHRILVKGPAKLRGRKLESPDLRAGLAFVLAGIIAGGESVIHNVYNIDRGYERIEERLVDLGVCIERKNEEKN